MDRALTCQEVRNLPLQEKEIQLIELDIEMLEARMDIAKSFKATGKVSNFWIAKNIFDFSDEKSATYK